MAVRLNSCWITLREVVSKESPSPNTHLNLIASALDRLVNEMGVFTCGGCGDAVKAAVGIGDTVILNEILSMMLQVFESIAVMLTTYVPGLM